MTSLGVTVTWQNIYSGGVEMDICSWRLEMVFSSINITAGNPELWTLAGHPSHQRPAPVAGRATVPEVWLWSVKLHWYSAQWVRHGVITRSLQTQITVLWTGEIFPWPDFWKSEPRLQLLAIIILPELDQLSRQPGGGGSQLPACWRHSTLANFWQYIVSKLPKWTLSRKYRPRCCCWRHWWRSPAAASSSWRGRARRAACAGPQTASSSPGARPCSASCSRWLSHQ